MARRLKLVKGGAHRGALASIEDAQVTLGDGSAGRVTMHFIEGTRAQIRRQLMQSIDAFFELLEEQ
jgi:hypothetical protein